MSFIKHILYDTSTLSTLRNRIDNLIKHYYNFSILITYFFQTLLLFSFFYSIKKEKENKDSIVKFDNMFHIREDNFPVFKVMERTGYQY